MCCSPFGNLLVLHLGQALECDTTQMETGCSCYILGRTTFTIKVQSSCAAEYNSMMEHDRDDLCQEKDTSNPRKLWQPRLLFMYNDAP